MAIRNIRRDANHHIKELLKDKKITEDEERRSEEDIQKLTDKAIKDVDDVVKSKEHSALIRFLWLSVRICRPSWIAQLLLHRDAVLPIRTWAPPCRRCFRQSCPGTEYQSLEVCAPDQGQPLLVGVPAYLAAFVILAMNSPDNSPYGSA